MDRLTGMAVFVQVVERGGFSAAAAQFAMSPTMASKHVRALEERVGARLLHRTTRRRSLTEAGRLYFERCKAILAQVDDAEAGAAAPRATPRGLLRLSAPVSFGARCLAPALVEFLKAFPEVRAEVILSDRVVDLIDEGFDAAIRVGRLADSSLVARPLAPYRVWLCASPGYLATRGTPRAPRELSRHVCLGFVVARGRDTWRWLARREGGRVPVDVRLAIDNGEALRQAALANGGVIMQPEVLLADDVRAGRLTRLLPAFELPNQPMHVVTLPDRAPPARLRAFLDFAVARFASPPPQRPKVKRA